MPAKIVLLTPARRFIANRFGLGYQIPLGLVYVGGPLLDAGHQVRLIDNDLYGWPLARLVEEIRDFGAGYVLIGHTGSTAAHTTALRTIRALRQALPAVKIVYGGVYPSYAAKSILAENPEIDVIVRGEGEQIALDLIAAWEGEVDLGHIAGISWRKGDEIVINRSLAPIQDLGAYRPGWELVDWPRYKNSGMRPWPACSSAAAAR
jgi:anaerobic magnesium-protoporphyrin IX monomethyl ester cyclase